MFDLRNKLILGFLLLMCWNSFSENAPPELNATGRQNFCPGNSIKIVTDFSIRDDDDVSIESFFIQISSGYQVNFDKLTLTGSHPTINASWNTSEGKLSFTGVGGSEILYTAIENAVKDVEFSTTANTITDEKFFSFTIGDANYLPSTGHYYEYVSNLGITWSAARDAAAGKTYYGLTGYLATLSTLEEAQLAGEQAAGAGWIGGSDQETEGVWKWVTGPEAGTVFWNGQANGSTPNYANWNIGEPNNFRGNEDYAHVTDPSIGTLGAWNDLPNEGDPSGPYQPKGYVVEYGGTPGDSVLNISASTSIFIPKISSTIPATICSANSATIKATSSLGDVVWYDAETGGNLLFTGESYTTPILNNTTTFYATVLLNGCSNYQRAPVTVTVINSPTITSTTDDLICINNTATLSATASSGDIYWFDSLTSSTSLFVGNNYSPTGITSNKTYYVEAKSGNCISNSRTAVNVVVETTIPDFQVLDTNVILCKDLGTVTLSTINPEGNYNYVWQKDTVVLSENTASITVNSSGTYTVKAISQAGCESTIKTIVVVASEIASITKEDVVIVENSDGNSIEIITANLGAGTYEFSIDDEFSNFSNTPFFNNIVTGSHILYIRDKGGCGTSAYPFSILAYPKFFTPNNDGKNDLWNIKGYDKNLYSVSDIYIFNRFGTLLYSIGPDSQGWDGTYQGKKVSSNSYWFKTVLIDVNGFSITKTGSFSLNRN